ncbi:MAG: hypothetical protein A3D95_08050 [Betaproteobacteria bacterium RIFCSPHIGHO2_12_FULL_69_13]|nr:MAG: hypothetical protein A3D95_08050 [Betaproteobacteria bacterium RIFCSPHIGHO2_12_FULL_69_13]OGA67444.1 MAG: hypothetical protein A3G83_17690 [Betaproteobacteria bacterium RIFCSPLOWO2_12_FULL_68_20]
MSSEEAAPKGERPRDAIHELALQIYVQLCGRIYSASGAEKPQPKAVAQMSIKLAEIFEAVNLEFNPIAMATREAKNKAAVSLDSVEIDFASIGKQK